MNTSDFDYNLPPQSIAQTPVEPRDSSRLMVLERDTGCITHTVFNELGNFLDPGDILVINETRVIPARLYARKHPGGGRVELLLLRQIDNQTWEALAGGKGLAEGRKLEIEGGPKAEVIIVLEGPKRIVRFSEPLEPILEQIGHVPLPPYIHAPLEDRDRYQTVYARKPGSAAAPTAGLHFTTGLIQRLEGQGVQFATVTLHVGLDTFAPVTEDRPEEHKIHTEWCEVSEGAARSINAARKIGRRIVAVGTTSVRTLETAAQEATPGDAVGLVEGFTRLFILPGHTFKAVDAMITNFHLPRSSLIMMVSAFTGREAILKAYETAINEGYRFYSFGDAMLIL